jgi:molecular chaperone GrpE
MIGRRSASPADGEQSRDESDTTTSIDDELDDDLEIGELIDEMGETIDADELLVVDGDTGVGEPAPVIDAEVIDPDTAESEVGDAGNQAGSLSSDESHLAQERDEYLAALQRNQADFENYRKRVTRQQEEQSARAALDLVGKLLPVIDALDLAEAHLVGTTGSSDAAVAEEAQAISQARALLITVLTKEGLERVDEAEVTFDPVVHDAVAHAPDDGGSGETVVDEVLRSGYRWRGQVLRPAMVRVRG